MASFSSSRINSVEHKIISCIGLSQIAKTYNLYKLRSSLSNYLDELAKPSYLDTNRASDPFGFAEHSLLEELDEFASISANEYTKKLKRLNDEFNYNPDPDPRNLQDVIISIETMLKERKQDSIFKAPGSEANSAKLQIILALLYELNIHRKNVIICVDDFRNLFKLRQTNLDKIYEIIRSEYNGSIITQAHNFVNSDFNTEVKTYCAELLPHFFAKTKNQSGDNAYFGAEYNFRVGVLSLTVDAIVFCLKFKSVHNKLFQMIQMIQGYPKASQTIAKYFVTNTKQLTARKIIEELVALRIVYYASIHQKITNNSNQALTHDAVKKYAQESHLVPYEHDFAYASPAPPAPPAPPASLSYADLSIKICNEEYDDELSHFIYFVEQVFKPYLEIILSQYDDKSDLLQNLDEISSNIEEITKRDEFKKQNGGTRKKKRKSKLKIQRSKQRKNRSQKKKHIN